MGNFTREKKKENEKLGCLSGGGKWRQCTHGTGYGTKNFLFCAKLLSMKKKLENRQNLMLSPVVLWNVQECSSHLVTRQRKTISCSSVWCISISFFDNTPVGKK